MAGMTLFNIYLIGLVIIIGMMILLWALSLRMKNSSIVDIFWGAGFVIMTWLYSLLTPDGFIVRKLLISMLVTIWGLRLSTHVFLRNHGKPEDFRYQKWRKESGKIWWWKSFFQVFLLQGILLWIISAPLLAAQYGAKPAQLIVSDYLGMFLWVVGFFFEATGDSQLKHFRADPANKGKVMSKGVWRYTRHPNYFGDATQWWGYFLIAVSAGGWWTIFSPILMTFLLLRVSGVALLEKTLETRPGYKEYIDQTSAFIPWFPRAKQPQENGRL
jgi:steroid 5-alpha reductase family enzyme